MSTDEFGWWSKLRQEIEAAKVESITAADNSVFDMLSKMKGV